MEAFTVQLPHEITMCVWLDLPGLGHGPVVGCCEHTNESLDTIRAKDFFAS
jgi:hypothetical protein